MYKTTTVRAGIISKKIDNVQNAIYTNKNLKQIVKKNLKWINLYLISCESQHPTQFKNLLFNILIKLNLYGSNQRLRSLRNLIQIMNNNYY